MGYYTYLVRKDNKTMFELGKGPWVPNVLIKTEELLTPESIDEWKCPLTHFERNSNLFEYVEYGLNTENQEVITELAENILTFCDDQNVWICWDTHDAYWDLKKDGYKTIAGRYADFKPEI